MGNGIRHLTVNQLQQTLYECEQPMVNYNRIGQFTNEGFWNRYVCGLITHNNQPRLTHLIKTINQSFEQLEQKGIKLFDSTVEDPLYRARAEAYRSRFQPYFKLAETIEREVERLQKVDPVLKEEYHKLKRLEVGLRYNLEWSNGGLDPLDEPQPDCLAQLITYTQEWKNAEKLATNKEINPLEMAQLKEAARYPEWVALLQNAAYRKEFMGWAIRDYNPVGAFIKYEATCRKMKAALLWSPLGYSRDLDSETLAIQLEATKVDGVIKKVLTLPFYQGDFREFDPSKQTRVNILKPTEEIHFERGNYRLTVEEFFKESAKKNLKEVNVNLCANWGFVNFHPVHGPWNAESQSYDAPPYQAWSKEDWIYNVPASRIVTQEELERQYGAQVRDQSFFYKAMSTRKNLDLNALDCHGFWQLYISTGNGKWKVINAGVYAYRFQKGLLDGLALFCATVVRVLSLIDQNGSYTHRQRAAYPIFPTEEEGKAVLERIFKVMTTRGVFQFAGRNCAYCVQQIGEKCMNNLLPNLFRLPISKVKAGFAPLDRVLAWADRRDEWIKWMVVTLIHKLFQSGRGIYVARPRLVDGQRVEEQQVWYSVADQLWKNHDIYNPAYLAHQITEAKATGEGPFVKGELYWGNTEERLAGLPQDYPNQAHAEANVGESMPAERSELSPTPPSSNAV